MSGLILNSTTLSGLANYMIGLSSRVRQRGENVVSFEQRIVFENLFKAGSRAQEFQHIHDTHALATNAGAATALAGFDGDTLKELG